MEILVMLGKALKNKDLRRNGLQHAQDGKHGSDFFQSH